MTQVVDPLLKVITKPGLSDSGIHCQEKKDAAIFIPAVW